MCFQDTVGGKSATLVDLRYDDMDIGTVITTYNTALTEAGDTWKIRRRQSLGSPKMFSTSVLRGKIITRGDIMQKKQKRTGKLTRGSSR